MSKALELGSDLLDESSLVSLRNSNESLALTRNGVVGSTTLHGDNSVVDLGRLEESSHDVDRVATTKVDLDTRVTTAGVVDDELLDGVTLDGLTLSLEVDLVGETTSATDADLAALLRIDVDQVLGLEDAGLEGGSTVKTGLLISGDEDLERTVLELLVGKEGEAGTDTDTIIGTEGSTLGADVLAIAVGLERIGLHVDGAVIGLLADHIHMALVADDGLVLETLGGLDSDNEVIGSINVGFVTEFIGGLLQESEDLLVAEELALLVGTTGDLGDGEEVLPGILITGKLIHQILKIPRGWGGWEEAYLGRTTGIVI